ncbi:beta galactosidase jelly roll domain-containing protein [Spirosoma sp. RP8]|uniref:Beta galactosidase jelly roll domain-containing protein n=1 Tax=Spirosoma liriopis TaxID=2937440 RepID=A0ABT0HJT4_9BACT|nr:glycoside hydrolase family 2 TIM barrel-domain containing protein [Spirosoma liriopis]MCK8492435.1 beta galactosidase jelly roll domain-containing protein [Spirosoma liriopis]
MRRKIQRLLLAAGLLVTGFAQGQYSIRDPKAIPLNGEWRFALDPVGVGETEQWYGSKNQPNGWDKVKVPHCFSVDPRYQFYTGATWYRRTFAWQPSGRKRVLLHFDGSYYATTVWLNGKKVGSHEGGYTPFSFDVTDFLTTGSDNDLAISVNNNTWLPGSIPGAKDNGRPNDPFPGWMNYGGLIRPVYLTVEPDVYVENVKVEAVPDLAKGTATLTIRTRIRNASGQAVTPTTQYQVRQGNKTLALKWKNTGSAVGSNQTAVFEAEAPLKASDVTLWSVDRPTLYDLQVVAGNDTVRTHFGIRKVEVRNTQLLLNGQPIKVAGGNRVVDYPGLGSMEPDWLIEKDLRLMKEAGMEFHRLTHYTPSEAVYDWADRNGMLIITEAGNWQLTPSQMDSDTVRRKFQQQFREMAERDWNHPCVIAYSVGNEYLSEMASGQRWTKDMIAFARSVDPTRLYTFASMRLNILPKKPEDEASQYCDFVSTNTYGNHARALDHIHQLYPDKPILISEWGRRADTDKGDTGQIADVEQVIQEIRKRPYVIGASWWSFNDYQSRHQGTNANGYRPWGLVGPDRNKRPMYATYQREMAPVTVEKLSWQPGPEGVHTLTLRVTARKDFPAYVVQGYSLRLSTDPSLERDVLARADKLPLPTLQPGQSVDLTIPVRGFDKTLTVTVSKPTDFSILSQSIDLTNDTRTSNR